MASKKSDDVLAKISEYKVIPELTLAQKVAHFLDWAATHVKKTYFSYSLICKAVRGLAHVPRMNTNEVEAVRKTMQRAKQILRDKYKRGFDFSRGLGVRATVDDNDTVNYTVATAAKRMVSSKMNLDKVSSIVDPSKLSSKEASYFENVTQASKRITNGHIQALLPPKPTPAQPSPRRTP